MDNFFANRAVINLFLVKIGLVGFDEGACAAALTSLTRERDLLLLMAKLSKLAKRRQ